MVVEVPGEELNPEDCAGWMKVRTNGRSDGSAEARPNSHVARRVIERIERGAKMPRVLPREAIKVIMRPRGGLDLSRVSIVKVMCAIGKAARVEMEDMGKDTLCPNVQQNIVVVCTEDEQRARRYANVEVLVVEGKSFETKAYVAAPYGTTKGVIRGVPLEHSAEDIDRNVVGPRNPTARATQRIGSSATVIVVFEGGTDILFTFTGRPWNIKAHGVTMALSSSTFRQKRHRCCPGSSGCSVMDTVGAQGADPSLLSSWGAATFVAMSAVYGHARRPLASPGELLNLAVHGKFTVQSSNLQFIAPDLGFEKSKFGGGVSPVAPKG
ncbi:uncharacterized protein ISCGN_032621 [Ixodes scapularis]